MSDRGGVEGGAEEREKEREPFVILAHSPSANYYQAGNK